MRKTLLALAFLIASPALAQEQQQPPPTDTAAPAPQAVTHAPANPPMTGPRILISTSMGDITLQLDSVRAPKSVANVLRYVWEKHYDNTAFYRVAHGFVIQMGSFDAKGKGRPIHKGIVPLEANNGLSNL
ncbi:MAG TPA: peptidylprolyl isomerase, partial [Rhizomicrobium sp.]|nr:peptidylprolyl isomerase [Rhizomicrobium sp.]